MKTTTEYLNLIRQWGIDRKITTNGNTTAQVLKFVSEYSEYRQNLQRKESIKDDIGDMLVVLVMIADLENLPRSVILAQLDGIALSLQDTQNLIGRHLEELTDGVLKGNKLDFAISTLSLDIHTVAKVFNLSIEECLEQSWNDIKDRKGIMTSSGVFVKSTDAEYQRILIEENNA